MPTRTGLLDAHAKLTVAVRASESWAPGYLKTPAAFHRLLDQEAQLHASVLDYLTGLAQRVPRLVNWTDTGLTAAAIDPQDSAVWEAERAAFAAAVSSYLAAIYVIGANAGEIAYNRPLGITTLDEAILYAADHHTADLVSQVTKTTRRLIQRAIKRSVTNGENVDQTIDRIRKLIASPIRAEMIAQTESVNAYQGGLDVFGEKSAVKSWTWECLPGACELCAPLDGVTKKVGEEFTLGNGDTVSRPPSHVRCRCGRIANYDK